MFNLFLVALGSVVGGCSRYSLASLVQHYVQRDFPYGTFVVNLLGCFAIGLFNGLAQDRFQFGLEARLLFVTGFCGGFTTFSALILETLNLVKGGHFFSATTNVIGSLVLGITAFLVAEKVGLAL